MKYRNKSREIALQVLYQYDLRGEEILNQIPNFLKEKSEDPEIRKYSYEEYTEILKYAKELVDGCLSNWKDLEGTIAKEAKNWTLERMPVVDRTILRMAAYEMCFRKDIPPEVAINEAIELGKQFSTANSGKFINGLLDQIRKNLPKTSTSQTNLPTVNNNPDISTETTNL